MSKLDTTHLRTDSKPAANMAFAIAGVSCFADTFVQGVSSILRIKFSAKTPRHRKPPKRYRLWQDDSNRQAETRHKRNDHDTEKK